MQRRSFIKNTALGAAAVGTYGFVSFNGDHYTGDCETTTDILGPFYRPGSPVRNNLIIPGVAGSMIELSGSIKHNDCKTPYPNARIELWHCSPKGEYDNTSDDFLYRGTAYSDEKGRYNFKTLLPVSYGVGAGATRPAHFHLMITAAGYQPFITQLYFAGDKYIKLDPYASSPNAKRRILNLQNLKDGSKKVTYDISMSPKLAAESPVLDKLTGTYTDVNDKTKLEFFKRDKSLWLKNKVYGMDLEYIGDNTFQFPAIEGGDSWKLRFELNPQGPIKLTSTEVDEKGAIKITTLIKDM